MALAAAAKAVVAPITACSPVASQKVVATRSAFVCGTPLRNVRAAAAPQAGISMAAAERPLWLPGTTPPSYLDGSLPGDFGFDPLGLGSDPDSLKWFVQAELVHARWAMLGAAGILIPEALNSAGILNIPHWQVAGEAQYFADAKVLTIIELNLMAWAEIRRWMDISNPGSVNVDPIFKNNKLNGPSVGYPGFDPLGFANTPAKLRDYQVREIKNGRLAMLAVVGFFFQALYTGGSPIDNLSAHIADPGHNTIFNAL